MLVMSERPVVQWPIALAYDDAADEGCYLMYIPGRRETITVSATSAVAWCLSVLPLAVTFV